MFSISYILIYYADIFITYKFISNVVIHII